MSDTPTKDSDHLNDFMAKYLALAKKCKREQRMLMNHVCVRVENIDRAEAFLEQSFSLRGFLRPGGELFSGERELSVLWINEDFYLELMQPREPQKLGYDTGSSGSQPIGHLSEVGFFVPDMDKALDHLGTLGWRVTTAIEDHGARMCKIDTPEPSGFPVELIDVEIDSD
ncbi:MAG: VOC family protein [Gammaproteobacteria bacterium]|nr:VOC family protein [Gammaproteobacteria bacterium]